MIAVPVDDKDVNISEDVGDIVCVVVAADVAAVVSGDVNSTIILHSTLIPLLHDKFHAIGATCRLCRAKDLKIML